MIDPKVKKLRRIAKHLAAKHPELVPKLAVDKGPSPDGLGQIRLQHMPSMRNVFGIKPLVWLGGKVYKTLFNPRKGRSGQLTEHTAAIADNAAYDWERMES